MRIVQPGEGEVIADSPQRRVEILCDHDAVHATLSRFGPGQEGASLHIHRRHHDLFYVVEGELTLHLGDAEDVLATAGTLVCVPPLVVHGFGNTSARPMRYLNLHAPGVGFAGYLRGLRDGVQVVYDQEDPPASGALPSSEVRIGELPLVLEKITVTDRPGGGTSQKLECYFVLSGPRAGTWIEFPPGVPYSFDEDGDVVHISAG
jgi:mannose-6-phosphate isomerase-like protein (cupin superfamily)